MTFEKLRWIGAALCLVAHACLVYEATLPGVCVSLLAQCLLIPYSVTTGMWDYVVVDSFYIVVGLSKLVG